ncbi:MAG: NAD-dependent epimerase/dehydratase family protein [Deltaproteobacteria bacterium]|nr:NAD-dependent epimerase/dehydratase family protein [Deltaproteobacteria bacterium]
MTILVTGGGGFLGRNIVRALLDRGETVRIFSRQRYPEIEAWGAEAVQGDLVRPEDVERAVKGATAVFHTAARVGYWGPYAEYHATNVEGTRALLRAAEAAGVSSFVHTSSPSVVLGPTTNIEHGDESLPYVRSRIHAYGTTKGEGEALVLAANRPGFGTAALRPHFIYGPGDSHIVPRLLARARAGKLVQVGDGTNQIDVTYIENAVSAHLGAFDALVANSKAVGGRAYFIGDREPVRLWSFVNDVLTGFGVAPVARRVSFSLAKAIGFALEKSYAMLGIRDEPPLTRMAAVMLGRSHYFSHARAARDFGYDPQVSTHEGLSRLFRAGDGAA